MRNLFFQHYTKLKGNFNFGAQFFSALILTTQIIEMALESYNSPKNVLCPINPIYGIS
jgi:hypothetical protein